MVFNRQDCCSERLSQYRIRVGNSSDPFENPICDNQLLTGGGVFGCNLWGRYLAITLESFNPLTLCEVKAFESPNLALSAVNAVQSSTTHEAPATRPLQTFMSGDWNGGTCTHTNLDGDAWWYVDLGSEKNIAGVSI